MISHFAIAMAIAQERQEFERRIRRRMAIGRYQQGRRSIRQRIGGIFIRMGQRLIAAPPAELARSR